MELLIPGLILVAFMAWLSTRIKKQAADAFVAEPISTEDYSLVKPEGFLHVVGDKQHDFMAYSKEFGEDENAGVRRATVEIDLITSNDIGTELEKIRTAAENAVDREETGDAAVVETDERANEREFRAVYKLIPRGNSIQRLRFAALAEHFDEYSSRIDETLESFVTKQA